MKNFNDIGELVSFLYGKADAEAPASIVAGKPVALDALNEFLDYDGTDFIYFDVDDDEYGAGAEYYVTVSYDGETGRYSVSMEPAFSPETGRYIGTDGHILFHEDVNSKAYVQVKDNENVIIRSLDWFVIGGGDAGDAPEGDNGKGVACKRRDGGEDGDGGSGASVDGADPASARSAGGGPRPDGKADKGSRKPSVKWAKARKPGIRESFTVNGKKATRDEYDKAVKAIDAELCRALLEWRAGLAGRSDALTLAAAYRLFGL